MALTLNDIFLLRYFSGKPVNSSLPDYLLSEYGLNWKKRLDAFVANGYLGFTDYSENIYKKTIPELKNVLHSHGLKATGKKQDLIDTILKKLDESVLKELFKESRYKLTEKGTAEINDNYIFLLNKDRNYNFSTEEIRETRKTLLEVNKGFTDRDVLWSLFNGRQLRASINNNWSSFSSAKYHMGSFLLEEGRHKAALEHYCTAAFVELSGMANENRVESFSMLHIPPALIGNIEIILSVCNLSLDEFKDYFLNQAVRMYPRLPFSYFSLENMFSIISDCLKGIEFNEAVGKHKRFTPDKNSKLYKYYDYDYGEDEDETEDETEEQNFLSIESSLSNVLKNKINEIEDRIKVTPQKNKKRKLLKTITIIWVVFWSFGILVQISANETKSALISLLLVILGILCLRLQAQKGQKK